MDLQIIDYFYIVTACFMTLHCTSYYQWGSML